MRPEFETCKCGHFEFDHELGLFPLPIGNKCREAGCVCRRYRKHALMTSREAEEYRRSLCSPSQQPTSGTSPSPSLSVSPATGGLIHWQSLSLSGSTFLPPSPSPSEPSPSKFQPEKRSTPVVGFRTWYIESRHRVGIGPGWWLKSLNAQFGIWTPGVNVAHCYAVDFSTRFSYLTPSFHAGSPDPNCHCGFYVLTDFDKVPFETQQRTTDLRTGITVSEAAVTMMVGAVVGWGRVVQHGDEGWRAEKVQLIALLDCKVSDDHLRVTHEVAKCYGVPVVGRKALELLAAEYGDRLSVGATA